MKRKQEYRLSSQYLE